MLDCLAPHYLPIEIELENNKCCLEIHNSSDSVVKFTFGNEIGYFDAQTD